MTGLLGCILVLERQAFTYHATNAIDDYAAIRGVVNGQMIDILLGTQVDRPGFERPP
jgi:hypothetical protein